MAEEAKKRGRPATFDRAVADQILERLSEGESLRSICRDEGMPSEGTVRLWATVDREGFHSQYTRAREHQMDSLAEDILEISDDKDADAQRSRLQVDTRKWLMSKIAPKRFGDKVSMEHTGKNGGPIQTVDLTNVSSDDLDRLQSLFGSLAGASGDDAETDQGGEGTEG